MSAEEKEDFKSYLKVLNNEEAFYCFDWCDKELTFDDYLSSIESNTSPDIEGIALVDIDNQNGKELIINLYEGGGNYLILTRENQKIYGTNMGARLFEELQMDGKYLGSGGAGDLYFQTMKIDSHGVETNCFGELHGEEQEDGTLVDCLKVNGQTIDNPQQWIDENYANPVDWIEGL